MSIQRSNGTSPIGSCLLCRFYIFPKEVPGEEAWKTEYTRFGAVKNEIAGRYTLIEPPLQEDTRRISAGLIFHNMCADIARIIISSVPASEPKIFHVLVFSFISLQRHLEFAKYGNKGPDELEEELRLLQVEAQKSPISDSKTKSRYFSRFPNEIMFLIYSFFEHVEDLFRMFEVFSLPEAPPSLWLSHGAAFLPWLPPIEREQQSILIKTLLHSLPRSRGKDLEACQNRYSVWRNGEILRSIVEKKLHGNEDSFKTDLEAVDVVDDTGTCVGLVLGPGIRERWIPAYTGLIAVKLHITCNSFCNYISGIEIDGKLLGYKGNRQTILHVDTCCGLRLCHDYFRILAIKFKSAKRGWAHEWSGVKGVDFDTKPIREAIWPHHFSSAQFHGFFDVSIVVSRARHSKIFTDTICDQMFRMQDLRFEYQSTEPAPHVWRWVPGFQIDSRHPVRIQDYIGGPEDEPRSSHFYPFLEPLESIRSISAIVTPSPPGIRSLIITSKYDNRVTHMFPESREELKLSFDLRPGESIIGIACAKADHRTNLRYLALKARISNGS